MNNTPLLSVIIPTYKRPQKLARSLQSIQAATISAHEIIVVDDCPLGSGFDVAKSVGARYVNKAGTNRGLSASRNIGMNMARGVFIAFVDDDDFFAPNGIDALINQAGASTAVIHGDYARFDSTVLTQVSLAGTSIDRLLVGNVIPVGAYLIQRAAINKPFDIGLRSHEDWEFLLAHILSGGIKYVPETIVMIDKTENESTSMHARRKSMFWLDFLSIYARFPAPHLAEVRAQALQRLGINLPVELLRFEDSI
jgi:glycosyltransferase involved in cell wall biosynthesis